MKINYYEISRIPTVDARKVLATIEDDEKHPERKRRRLDNLNLEERVLRRKLKNRVAAQTARDRKKAYMDSLDSNLGRVERENKFLKQSNEELRSQVHQLLKSNSQLRARLGLTPPASPTQEYKCLNSKKDKYEIITPSVCDHDHIAIKQEDTPAPTTTAHTPVEIPNPPTLSCFRKQASGSSETELLLDVIGDNEPIELSKSEFGNVFQLSENTGEPNNSLSKPVPQNTPELLMYEGKPTIKLEEIDVGRLLSDDDTGNISMDDINNEIKDTINYNNNNNNNINNTYHNSMTNYVNNTVTTNTNNFAVMTTNNSNDVACPTSPESLPSSPLSPTSSSSIEDAINDAINISELCGDELSLVDAGGYRIVDQLGVDNDFMSCGSGDLHDPFADLFPSLI